MYELYGLHMSQVFCQIRKIQRETHCAMPRSIPLKSSAPQPLCTSAALPCVPCMHPCTRSGNKYTAGTRCASLSLHGSCMVHKLTGCLISTESCWVASFTLLSHQVCETPMELVEEFNLCVERSVTVQKLCPMFSKFMSLVQKEWMSRQTK